MMTCRSIMVCEVANVQLTDGGPPLTPELPDRSTGPHRGGAPGSASTAQMHFIERMSGRITSKKLQPLKMRVREVSEDVDDLVVNSVEQVASSNRLREISQGEVASRDV